MPSKQSKRRRGRGKGKNLNKNNGGISTEETLDPHVALIQLQKLWETEQGQDNEGHCYASLIQMWYTVFATNSTKERVEVLRHGAACRHGDAAALSSVQFIASLRKLKSLALWPPSGLQYTEKTKQCPHRGLKTLVDDNTNIQLLDLHLTPVHTSPTSTPAFDVSSIEQLSRNDMTHTCTTFSNNKITDNCIDADLCLTNTNTNTGTNNSTSSVGSDAITINSYAATNCSNSILSNAADRLTFLDVDAVEWYRVSNRYWQKQEATANGMLGGYGHISDIDIKASYHFLLPFLEGQRVRKVSTRRAVDMGAGIGRIAKNLLCKLFDKVDIVEPNATFFETARQELRDCTSVDQYISVPLQKWTPDPNTRYDVIWVQWVLLYLTDSDLIAFLRRCQQALSHNGIIVIKENCTLQGGFIVDKNDASITRSLQHLRLILQASGLKILKEELQPNFPRELLPVKMFAVS
jgi:protein N-terminal methyltransferase